MARQTTSMNRIRELREAAGLSHAELAARVGTSPQQVSRHELGHRRLTIQWMQRYAVVFGVSLGALIAAPELSEARSDVEPATIEGMPWLSQIIASRGLAVYRVMHSRIPDAGIVVGQLITVDSTAEAIRKAEPCAAVLARIVGTDLIILRQYLPPQALVTNEPGQQNAILRLDDRSVQIEIIGVVIRQDQIGAP